MAECLKTLMDITESGYWPFASPCPCSTEVTIKNGIEKAIWGIDSALYWHDQMFTKHGRDDMKAPRMEIVDVK